MPMERSNSLGSTNSSYSTTSRSVNTSSPSVVSIECLKGSSRADEWTGDILITGDIVEELRVGNMILRSPFKNGKNGIQKIMHNSFKAKETSISVRVRRGSDDELFIELQYLITLCLYAASRKSRMVRALTRTPLQEGYVSYPWEKRMNELLSVPNSSSFYSLLLLPKASDKVSIHYNDLEDTLSRANAWLIASQASGVPIVFMNIQTESLLTKISGETASCTVSAGSLSDLSNLANASLYGFEDYHGVDIGVVRAVRLWYSPLGGEILINIKIKENDVKLGFAISRTEEGFIHISSVTESDEDAPSSRSGLSNLYKEAIRGCKLLVVSRISNQKVLPWIVSPTGAVRCFDTISLSQKLSLHRHAKVPILMHVFLWDRSIPVPNGGSINRLRTITPTMLPEVRLARQPNDNTVMPLPLEVVDERGGHSDESELRHDRDTAGEFSFRFHDFSLPNNWV
ncbi:unnamed protein product [Withania somnifera]